MAHPTSPKYDDPQFKKDWLSDMTTGELSEKYGGSYDAVWAAARRRGFPSRPGRAPKGSKYGVDKIGIMAYFEPDVFSKLSQEAMRRRTSLAQIIREAADLWLKHGKGE